MKILWIEDQPERKIDQFKQYLHSRNIKLPVENSLDEKIHLLESVGITLHKDFSFFVNILKTKSWNKKLTNFFNDFDLIFCDVNLSDDPQKILSEEVYSELKEITGIDIEKEREGEGLFKALITLKGEIEVREIAYKFYFFSAYDGLPKVRETIKQLLCDKLEEQEWTKIHIIENKGDKLQNEFQPFNFTNNKFDRLLRGKKDWNNQEDNRYYHDDCGELHDIVAKYTDGHWKISFYITNPDDSIYLLEDKDFSVAYNISVTTQERICKAINGIPLATVEATYHKYYELGFLARLKSELNNVLINYNLSLDCKHLLQEQLYTNLFENLRSIFAASRKAIQDIVFPSDYPFESEMKKKEFAFWSQQEETKEVSTLDEPYSEEIVQIVESKAKSQDGLPDDWKRYKNFHEKLLKCKNRYAMNRILISCPKYIFDTINWAYSNILSAYKMHEEEEKSYESSLLDKKLMPSNSHAFKATVEALFLVLDFIIEIDNNEEIIRKMRNFIPYYYDSEKERKSIKPCKYKEPSSVKRGFQ